MQLLLDTHIVLACVEKKRETLAGAMLAAIEQSENSIWVSLASLWELAIKSRLGKLPIATGLQQWPDALGAMGFGLLPIYSDQVFADIGQEPSHKDPFDRLLLGVCAAENMRLVTVDRALINHPLAWRES